MNFEQMVTTHLDVRQRAGDEWLALCPYHDDHSPSFHINITKQVFICFSCGASGNARALAQHVGQTKVDFSPGIDAMERSVAAMDTPVEEARIYPDSWLNQYDTPHDYWKRRGFSPLTIAQFRLGYDPFTKCVTIPVRTLKREVLGVVRRKLTDERPKYVYPKGLPISRSLFGAWDAQDHPAVAICEGPLDAVAMWDAGVPAVAMYGSRLSEAQARLLRIMGVRTLILATDNDDAGLSADRQIISAMTDMTIKVFDYPADSSAKDPGEMTRAQRRTAYESAASLHAIRLGGV